MSFISNFINKLLGKGQSQKQMPIQPNNNYLQQWEKEREKRVIEAEARLKNWILALLKQKGTLSFSWESGGDEAFVTFADRTDADEEKFQDMEEYIVNKLDIPDAGEFQMNGNGKIYIENNLVRVKYSSTIKEIIDYDEETEEEIYSNEEQDSGDQILFSI
jgi:hypothetical protein